VLAALRGRFLSLSKLGLFIMKGIHSGAQSPVNGTRNDKSKSSTQSAKSGRSPSDEHLTSTTSKGPAIVSRPSLTREKAMETESYDSGNGDPKLRTEADEKWLEQLAGFPTLREFDEIDECWYK
jgi:hypothetical protein